MWQPELGDVIAWAQCDPGEALGWFRLESLLQELGSVSLCKSVIEAANPGPC